MSPNRASVLISTYEQPRELELALAALARQDVAPLDVIVCDDGSGSSTADVIERWKGKLGCRLEHVWQSDRGYRKARILNEGARRAAGDHFIFLDGDSFPHRCWVADHVASADGKSLLCGRRVKLGPEISPTVSVAGIEGGAFDSAFSPRLIKSRLAGDTSRLSLGVRLPRPVARLLHPRPRKLMGVNFSLPRAAFTLVNGFNEAWKIYGHEDRDLELRLLRAGVPSKPVLNRAIVFHLHHDERERTEETRKLIAEAEASEEIRCAVGFDQGDAFDAQA